MAGRERIVQGTRALPAVAGSPLSLASRGNWRSCAGDQAAAELHLLDSGPSDDELPDLLGLAVLFVRTSKKLQCFGEDEK